MNRSSLFTLSTLLRAVRPRNESLMGRIVGGATIAVLFMGSTLLTPIYDLYRASYGLSILGLGLLYAVYVIGNLVALLFLGRLSDQIGRRPIVLASLALATVSALMFLFAVNALWLFVARIVNGLAVGLGSGAATAWITEFTPEDQRASAASTMTAFNFLGLALGSIVAGFLVQYAPRPLHLPFMVYLVVLAVSLLAVLNTRETLQMKREATVDLTPRIGVPKGIRVAFLAPAAAGFAAMAMVGFYAALGPTTFHNALHIENNAVSGVVVALMFIAAALVIIATRTLPPRRTMMLGLITIPVAVVLLVSAQRIGSIGLMLMSATVAGMSALGYRGGLAVVGVLTPPERRAEVASTYFICCFLGNAIPIIGVTAISKSAGPEIASMVFALVLSIIGIAALVTAKILGGERIAPDCRS